jgi:transposase-like protein
MNLKSPKWLPVAAVLSAVNLAAVAAAVQPGEVFHATSHAMLALGLGLWAQRLYLRRAANALGTGGYGESQLALGGEQQAAIESLESEMSLLRQELSEAQERLDFAERVLAREPERPSAE